MIAKNRSGWILHGFIDITENQITEYSNVTGAYAIVKVGDKYLIGYNNWRKQWEFPVGGIEAGETARQAAYRELFEETHQENLELKFKGLFKVTDSHGIQKYQAGEIVGFCNADLKENYFRHSKDNDPESWDGIDSDSKVLAIVCYIVAPDMRGMGIADSLLEYACSYAEENGFDYIEGYPSDGAFDARNCGGTDSMYIKRDFQIQYIGNRIIARKKLGN